MERFNTRQCAVCQKVCQSIRTKNATALVDADTVMLYPVKHGTDVGYTASGFRVEGYFVKPGEKLDGMYEVHRLHLCGRK